ncbi:WD40 repeat-like protein [Hortaea werneckii]|nr:WD40 repeat-like protein [Hortaea werneckii]KAI7013475.1 WD40 repeat-like protein [Hortaea werneckii]KAI7254247.1 WD40 repeat-like protein [Hortaea werneckii]
MEAAVRWSPHSTAERRRFLLVDVAESSLTLNEVNSDLKPGPLSFQPVSSRRKLPPFGAFAWSPVQESLLALGHVSGNASVVDLSNEKPRTEQLLTFKTKQQRKCNSVALSSQNWLAVALDKTRSDVCLNIYDVGSEVQEPVRRLCPAELVSSVRFFPSQPQEVVATAQRSFVRLYDLRDRSSGSGNRSLQAPTRNINNITIDPLDENYFASSGSTGDPSVTVWDKRWIAQSSSGSQANCAVFNFSPAVEVVGLTTVWSLRYSGVRRGRLALCASTGEIKVMDMMDANTSPLHTSDYLPSNPYGGGSWQSNRYVSRVRKVQEPIRQRANKGHDDGTRAVAFDWTQETSPESEQSMLILRSSREVEVHQMPLVDTHVNVNARQDLSTVRNDVAVLESKPQMGTDQSATNLEQRNAELTDPVNNTEGSDTLGNNGALDGVSSEETPHIRNLLAPANVAEERCRRGYGLNCEKNMKVIAGDWHLERLWEIVGRFHDQAADNGMMHAGLDLSYVGVADLWSETAGNLAKRRSPSRKTQVDDAIIGLNNDHELPAFEGERTGFPEHRQLCLAACGWKFTTDTLEAECQELIERGKYYLSIVQAVLHGYIHIALNLLRTLIRSKTIMNIGLGALLASDTINEEQREMCQWMAADTSDPGLKALLTFLITGDWRDVMKTHYLHLGYRVALGLKYLNDTELSGFMQTETARVIRNGDLEGILLTGLGERSLELFQTYLTRSADLQTVVLASAFTNPRYVDDIRWEMWRDTYFDQLQSWRCFHERARFTVMHARLCRKGLVGMKDEKGKVSRLGSYLSSSSSSPSSPAAPVTLKCNHCQAPLARAQSSLAPLHPTTPSTETPRTAGTTPMPKTTGHSPTKIQGALAANSGTVCLRCGRHMPRCALCNLWLGTPTTSPSLSSSSSPSSSTRPAMKKFPSGISTPSLRDGDANHEDEDDEDEGFPAIGAGKEEPWDESGGEEREGEKSKDVIYTR